MLLQVQAAVWRSGFGAVEWCLSVKWVFQNIFHPLNREKLILVNPFHSESLKESAETIFTNYTYLNSNFRVNNQINVKKTTTGNSPLRKKIHRLPNMSQFPSLGCKAEGEIPMSLQQQLPACSHCSAPLSSPGGAEQGCALPLLQHGPSSEAPTSPICP